MHVAGHVDVHPALAVGAGPRGAGVLPRAGREVAHQRRLDERLDLSDRCGRPSPRGGGRHYFTPPAVRPLTIRRWAARKAITTGALTTIAAAMSWFQYTLVCDE